MTSVNAIMQRYRSLKRRQAQAIANLVKKYSADAVKTISNTARKYKLKQCKEAAAAMKKVLVKKKLPGAMVELYFPNAYKGFVVSDKTGNEAISETGYHYGVYYNGRIYCNIYPEGVDATIWPSKFHALSDVGRTVRYYWF